MYLVSRLLLMLTVLASVYSTVLLLAAVGPLAWIVVGIVLFYSARRRRALTNLGSARWADEDDLRQAGMIDAPSGLILGLLPPVRNTAVSFARKVFAPALSAKEACLSLKAHHKRFIRLCLAVHVAVFAPTGTGKGVSCALPFLKTSKDAAVVIDEKGELYKLTALHRAAAFGHRIVVLDPFHVVTKTPDSFNPLDFIAKDNPLALDYCNALANSLVIRTGEEKEPHWNDSAVLWICGMCATVVQYGEAGLRSLQTIRDFLSNPQRLDLAVKLMCESDAWDGMLARLGGQLTHFIEREKSSTLTTVTRHLRFLDTLAVAASTKTSTFDPAELRRGKMTVYLILPPEHVKSQAGLTRMWIGSLLNAVVRGGPQEKNKVHFVLDEAASLGHLDCLDDAINKFRGYGIRLQLYYQSLGQLKRCFPEGQDQTLLSNTSQVFFGPVNDVATAEYVSSRLGETTICVESGGTSSGRSWQESYGAQPQQSTTFSNNENRNWQPQARKLLKPEEVMALSPRTAITFTPGLPPIRTQLIRYYEEPRLGRRPSLIREFVSAAIFLAFAAFLCLLSVGWAAIITAYINSLTNDLVLTP